MHLGLNSPTKYEAFINNLEKKFKKQEVKKWNDLKDVRVLKC